MAGTPTRQPQGKRRLFHPFRRADEGDIEPKVYGPCGKAWRETVLARAIELEGLTDAFAPRSVDDADRKALREHVEQHLMAARQAAAGGGPRSRRLLASVERATSNLDDAEVALLRLAPAWFVVGQFPSLYAQVLAHLRDTDPQRAAMEGFAARFTAARAERAGGATSRTSRVPRPPAVTPRSRRRRRATEAETAASEDECDVRLCDTDREAIIAAYQAAAREARREVARVRSFRNILYGTAAVLLGLVALLTLIVREQPRLLPLCFTPVETAVCPTHTGPRSGTTSAEAAASSAVPASTTAPSSGETPNSATTNGEEARQAEALDDVMRDATGPWDLPLIELVGALAAALSAAVALRGMRGTATPYSLPMALAVLKLPTGALSAVLGILLLRGEFIPGLSALDTSGQIIAWAIVFGAAQQLVTRMVDDKAQGVLDQVSTPGSVKTPDVPTPPRGAEVT